MLKISFTGDIMSSLQQDKALQEHNITYDEVFSNAVSIFSNSECVVANLETTIAGKDLGYTDAPASFNTPEQIIPAIKKLGVTFVTNANNHILDRGVLGMQYTIDALEKYGIQHTGCYKTISESNEISMVELKGIKIAILSYTYGTNSEFNGNVLKKNEWFMVDLLKEQLPLGKDCFQTRRNMRILASRYVNPHLMRFYYKVEKIHNYFKPYVGGSCIDTVNEEEVGKNEEFISRLSRKVAKARNKADFVVLCVHCGGQYNGEIGLFTQDVFKHIKKMDIDLVVGNHPHCVLGSFYNGKRFYTYSLGNFSFTPGGMWYVDTVFAEYSVVLHAYIDESTRSIACYTYSIVKNIVGDDKISRVVPVYNLMKNETDGKKKEQLLLDIIQVSKRFSGKAQRSIEKEYLLNSF